MELWDIYDIDRTKTDLLTERGQPLAPGQYHLVVHICIFNSRGELLIQQRQPWKKGYPDLWDVSAAGSALAGENSAAAAERELREELGLSRSFQNVRPFLTVHFPRGFDDFYLVEQDAELSSLCLQPEEVKDAKWASLEEIETMLDKKTFVPYYRDFLRLLFAMRKRRGSTTEE